MRSLDFHIQPEEIITVSSHAPRGVPQTNMCINAATPAWVRVRHWSAPERLKTTSKDSDAIPLDLTSWETPLSLEQELLALDSAPETTHDDVFEVATLPKLTLSDVTSWQGGLLSSLTVTHPLIIQQKLYQKRLCEMRLRREKRMLKKMSETRAELECPQSISEQIVETNSEQDARCSLTCISFPVPLKLSSNHSSYPRSNHVPISHNSSSLPSKSCPLSSPSEGESSRSASPAPRGSSSWSTSRPTSTSVMSCQSSYPLSSDAGEHELPDDQHGWIHSRFERIALAAETRCCKRKKKKKWRKKRFWSWTQESYPKQFKLMVTAILTFLVMISSPVQAKSKWFINYIF